jgi:sigma-E factor negative regulatory protein RseA
MFIDGSEKSAKERLSALADGELDAAAAASSCAAWSADVALRAEWHAWHVIGDVLRSEDLASDPRADRRLCRAVRERLEREAVVLAPTSTPTPRRLDEGESPAGRSRFHSRRWAAGAAVAAGLVLVVGTFAVLQLGGSPAPEELASAQRGAVPVVLSEPAPAAITDDSAPAVALVADSKLLRDAQLDRYLEAHKQFAGSSALGVPSTFLRSATVESAAR